MTRERGNKGVKRVGAWARRMLQGAVVVAVASSMPAAWSAGGVQVNNVAAGSAAITRDGNVTTIRTASQNTIINYQRLSVASGETLNFLQPSAASRVLNRIQGAEPTVIDGTLWSNGRVYLVNPAGVMFGNGAVVNVAGLYAAAGHISDGNFMAGINQFTGNTGLVSNQGVIQAGQIHLVGGSVANFGQIVTSGDGIVTMTAGKDVYIGESESPTGKTSVLVKVSSDTSAAKAGTGVSNSGTVDAGGGALYMGAGDLYAAGIYNNGTLKGASISLKSGASTNVNEGTVDASNAHGKGGTVEMLGDKVGVFGGTVDASGAAGGGTILVGGDVHGGGGVPVSTMAVVADGATLRADATGTGDGGKIVVFSSGSTAVGGLLSVNNGVGGKGGFVETSGLNGLRVTRTPNLGAGGTWLIDPQHNLLINGTVAGNTNVATVGTNFSANLDNAVLLVSNIGTALTSGNVTISTTGTGGGSGQTGVITWDSTAILTYDGLSGSSVTLTLDAGSDINFYGALQKKTSGSPNDDYLNVVFNSGGNVNITGVITTNRGSFTSSGADFALSGTLTTGKTSGNPSATGGSVTLNHTGVVTLGGVLDLSSNGATGNLTINGGTITQNAGQALTAGTLSVTAGGPVNLGATSNSVAAFSVVENTAGASVNFVDNVDLTLLASSAPGSSFTIQDNHNNLAVTGGVDVTGGTLTFVTTDLDINGGGSLTAGSAGVIIVQPLTPDETISLGVGGATLTLPNADLSRIISAGTLAIGSSGQTGAIGVTTMTLTGAVGLLSILGGNGTVTLTDGGSTPALLVPGDVSILAGRIVAANGHNGVAEIKTTGGSNISLTSGGSIGTSTNRIEIDAGTGSAALYVNAVADVYLKGVGSPGTLAFQGNNSAGSFDVLAAGDINPAGGGGTLTAPGTIVLNATGGIGITGALGINAGASVSLTTQGNGAAGNIHILVPAAGATLGSFALVTGGTGTQTDTIDGAGDLSVGGGFAAPAGDALTITAAGNLFAGGAAVSGTAVTLQAAGSLAAAGATLSGMALVALHAGTSGTGNLDISGAVLTGDTITLTAGNGLGAAAVVLAGATLSGFTNSAPLALHLEQDVDVASFPALGTGSALTLISHQGNMTISGDQNLVSLAAQAQTIYLTGNATVSGNMTLGGNLQINQNTTLAGTGGGSSLTITGAIAGSANSLSTSFPGVTSFGGGMQLGTLTVQAAGGTVLIGSGSPVSLAAAGDVAIGEALTLNGGLTVTSTGGGAVTFGGTIDSAGLPHSALTVNSSGLKWFKGDVGLLTPLGGLTTTGGGITQLGNGGAITIKTGSPITFNTDVLLAANTTLTAGGGTTGTVTFNATVKSAAASDYTLTINADDRVTFKGNVGDPGTSGQLGSLVVNATAAGICLGGGGAFAINTAQTGSTTGAQTLNGPVTLLGDTTLAVSGSAPGAITVTGLMSSGTASHVALTLNAAGDMVLAGGTSTTPATELGSIHTLGGGTTKFGGGGTISVITTGTQQYDAGVTLLGNTAFQGTGLTFNGSPVSIDAGTFDLTLISDAMSFGGGANSVTGSGNLKLLPLAAGDDVLLNATGGTLAGALVINSTGLSTFTGFALMTIGRGDGTGSVFVTAPTAFAPSAVLQTGTGGAISITSTLDTAGSLGLSGGNISVAAAVVATGGFFSTSAGLFTLGPAGSITTTDAPVTIANPNGLVTLDGPIAAGTGAVAVTGWGITGGAGGTIVGGSITLDGGAGAVSLSAAINGTGPLLISGNSVSTLAGATLAASSATINGGTGAVSIGDVVNVTSGFTSASAGGFTLSPAGTISISGGGAAIHHPGGPVTVNGVILALTGTITVTGLGISVGAGGGIGGQEVTLNGGAGADTIDGVVAAYGAVNILGTGVTINPSALVFGNSVLLDSGSGTIHLNHSLFTNGSALTLRGATVLGGGGAITLQSFNGTGAGDISIIGTVDATTTESLNLLAKNGTSAGNVSLLGVVGGAVPLGALNVSGNAFTINSNITTNGPIDIGNTGHFFIDSGTAAASSVVIVTGGAGFTAAGVPIDAGGAGTVNLTLNTSATSGAASPITLGSVGASATLGNLTLLAAGAGGDGAIQLADVTLGGALAATGGAFNNTGIIQARGIALNQSGNVVIDAALRLAGFAVTIDGAVIFVAPGAPISGSAITITGSGTVLLGDAITGTGPLRITGAGVLTGSSGALIGDTVSINGGSGAVVLAAPVNATHGFTSTSSGVFTLDSTGAITTADQNVTINHGGLITLAGPVGAGAGTVSLAGAGVSQTGGSITAGLLSLAGVGTFSLPQVNAVGTLTANVTGALTFINDAALTVAGVTTGGNALTLTTTTGDLTFTGTTSAAVLTLTAANVYVNATMSGTLLTVSNGLTTTADITIAGAVTVNGDASLGATLTSTAGTIDITGNAGGTGALIAGANVIVGGGFSAAGGISAGGLVSIAGPVTMTSGGSITAGTSISMPGGANMTGSLYAGTTIGVAGAGAIYGNVSAGGAITFNGPISLLGNLTSTTAGAVFLSNATVNGNMSVAGNLAFGAASNLAGNATAGGNLTVVGGVTIAGTFNVANVSIPGAVTLSGDTALNASGTTGVTLGNIAGAGRNLTVMSASALARVNVGTIGVDGTPIGNLAVNSNGLVYLGGSIFAQNVSFASAAGGALAAVPDHATIMNSGDLVIVADGTVAFAENEKLTVYDPALINSPANDLGTHASAALVIWAKSNSAAFDIVVGDINTQGVLILAAGSTGTKTIQFHNRHASAVAGGTDPSDLGADIFALGLTSDTLVLPAGFAAATGYTFDGSPLKFIGDIHVDNTHATPLPGGGGPRFQIGARDTTNAETLWFPRSAQDGNGAVINNNLLFVNQSPLPTLTQFFDPLVPRAVRDIEVYGVTRVPNAALGSIIPRDTQTITPERGQAISGALRDYLREVGIYARDLRTDELIEYLIGRGLYDDVPYELNPDQGAYKVAVNRLPYAPVLPVVEAARALLSKQEVDGKGNPVTENGKPKMVSQTEDVARAIGAAWQAYLDDMAAKNQDPKPLEFRACLEAQEKDDPKFALALNYLNQIRDLLIQIKNLGITPAEYEVSRNKILPKLRFANVDEKDFPLMIDGPSTRPGAGAVVTAPLPAPASAPK